MIMPVVTVLEAYYGGGVVLDYADAEGRTAAFELGLRTMLKMERASEPLFRVMVRDLTEWSDPEPFHAILNFLRAYVTPENRYFSVLCRLPNSEPYAFGVLSEDGSCVDVSPSWKASNAWYDEFWASMWAVGREMEEADPEFRLNPRF